MNANTLADKLEECAKINFWIDCTYEQYDDDKDFKLRAATMLRAQQAEIELLNAKLAYMFEQELKTARLNK